MGTKDDQKRKDKLLTIAAVVVLILAVLPIVSFAVFSVVDFKPIPTNKKAIEEPTLSRSEQRKKEREEKKAAEAAKQTVTQNQPVITTQTMPQPGQMPFGQGMMGPGQFDPSQMPQFGQGFGPGMGMGQFGNFDPANMPQFDPSQFQGMGMGFGQFGQGFDPVNMPQFDPGQMPQGGFGMGFGQGGFPGGMQGGFGQGMNNNGAGFMDANGAWNSPPFNPNGGGPNVIMADPVQTLPAGNQLIMINPLRSEGRPIQ